MVSESLSSYAEIRHHTPARTRRRVGARHRTSAPGAWNPMTGTALTTSEHLGRAGLNRVNERHQPICCATSSMCWGCSESYPVLRVCYSPAGNSLRFVMSRAVSVGSTTSVPVSPLVTFPCSMTHPFWGGAWGQSSRYQ